MTCARRAPRAARRHQLVARHAERCSGSAASMAATDPAHAAQPSARPTAGCSAARPTAAHPAAPPAGQPYSRSEVNCRRRRVRPAMHALGLPCEDVRVSWNGCGVGAPEQLGLGPSHAAVHARPCLRAEPPGRRRFPKVHALGPTLDSDSRKELSDRKEKQRLHEEQLVGNGYERAEQGSPLLSVIPN